MNKKWVVTPDGRKGYTFAPPAEASGLVTVIFPDATNWWQSFLFIEPEYLKKVKA